MPFSSLHSVRTVQEQESYEHQPAPAGKLLDMPVSFFFGSSDLCHLMAPGATWHLATWTPGYWHLVPHMWASPGHLAIPLDLHV